MDGEGEAAMKAAGGDEERRRLQALQKTLECREREKDELRIELCKR